MATYLYRLGTWAFTHPRRVLAAWAVVLLAVGAAAVAFKGETNNKFEVPGTESQRAQTLLEEKFPGAGGASARVVYVAPAGEKLTDPQNRAAVMDSVALAKQAAEVYSVADPYSAD